MVHWKIESMIVKSFQVEYGKNMSYQYNMGMLTFYARKLLIVHISTNHIVKFLLTEKNMHTPLKYYTITHSTHVSEVGKTSVTALDACLGPWTSILRNKTLFHVHIWGKIVRQQDYWPQ